jgi:hypothetical protein
MPDNTNPFERMLEPTDKLTLATRVLTALWLGLLLIEIGVWLAIWLFSGDLEAPWWLWTVLAGGVIIGGLRWFARKERS